MLGSLAGTVDEICGLMLSTITTTPADAAETLPNPSVAFAVKVCDPFGMPEMGAVHWPAAVAATVVFSVAPS